jgi:hypothetical protein
MTYGNGETLLVLACLSLHMTMAIAAWSNL